MTQTELADAIGISLASIQGYEAERVWPAMDTVKALANALKVSEPELFRDPNYKEPAQKALIEFAQLISTAAPDIVKNVFQLLESAQPVEPTASRARRTAKTSAS